MNLSNIFQSIQNNYNKIENEVELKKTEFLYTMDL